MSDATAARESWELSAGEEIAQGRAVLELLGGGRRYEAYLVWDERLLCRLVAKLLRPDQADEPAARRALRREAQAHAELAHPVLRRAFDVVTDPPHPHLLLEHVDGPSVRRLVRDSGPLPPERVAQLGRDLAAALHYLAGVGWLHLDVKPGNVLLGNPPRLIDLSLARRLDRVAPLRMPVGTAAYMAPEQCLPGGEPGPPADVWGLGATLYVAAVGVRPFRNSVPGSRYPQLHERARALPANLPRALAEPIAACLDPEPDARPAAADIAARLGT